MSRAYRLSVSESLNTVVRAKDHVSTRLELLEVLPADQMAELLKNELKEKGFEEGECGDMVREAGDLVIRVDPTTGTVSVHTEVEADVELTAERTGQYYDDVGEGKKNVEKKLKQEVEEDLSRKTDEKTADLQKEVTDRLERELADVQAELTQSVNRVTAEALKQKAAQMGQIKELTEDPETGSMTIVLEV